MENLLKKLVNALPFLTWLGLTIVFLVLLCDTNPYHRSVWFGSSNELVGRVYDIQSNVTSYFGLRKTNEEMLLRIGQLEERNQLLHDELQRYRDYAELDSADMSQYKFMIAHVVGNSISQAENYITLDKGSLDGIRQDFGVADASGIVGIVAKVSDHYSLVLSVLNPKLRLSVMLTNSTSFGSLIWDGKDYRYAMLEDLPRDTEFEEGDTVVTTGFTSSFPKDIPVGTVTESYDRGGSFLSLRIKLFADFNRLNNVNVIINNRQEERELLMTESDDDEE